MGVFRTPCGGSAFRPPGVLVFCCGGDYFALIDTVMVAIVPAPVMVPSTPVMV